MRTNTPGIAIVVAATLVSATSIAAAAEWGHLKGRFVYGGDAPEREKLQINKDVDFCAKHDPRSEELVVDPKTGGVANVVIWLETKRSSGPPAVHESYEAALAKPVVLDNVKCRFEPHVTLVRTGQTLKIRNRDSISHATALFLFVNDPIATTVGEGKDEDRKFAKEERLPASVTCPIHSWMKGYLLVKSHPYMAVSAADGSFELKNVPAGEWTFRVWHERPGYVDEVTLKTGPAKWRSGRVSLTVPASGANELGDIVLDPELLAGE